MKKSFLVMVYALVLACEAAGTDYDTEGVLVMKDFADIPQTNGTYPDVTAKNDTTAGAKDGTPLTKAWVDEVFGVFQAALQGASVTPNGSAEAAGGTGDIESSQFLQAIQLMFRPAGEVVMWPSDTIPPRTRLLALDGQRILRTSYPRLVTNVEQAYAVGGSFYRCTAAGVADSNGLYMQLPDWRGQFVRGRDTGGTVDPDGASRQYGDTQADAVQNHNHVIENQVGAGPYYKSEVAGADGSPVTAASAVAPESGAELEASATYMGDDIDSSFTQLTGVGRADADETRATNFMVQWCITY